MRCIYHVPRIILLQIFLYTYNFVSGATFNIMNLSSHTLSPVILPLLETFKDLFYQNNLQCCCILSWVSSMSWTVINYEKNKKKITATTKNIEDVPTQQQILFCCTQLNTALNDLKNCHNRETSCWARLQAFLTYTFMQPHQYFLHKSSWLFGPVWTNNIGHFSTLSSDLCKPHIFSLTQNTFYFNSVGYHYNVCYMFRCT